MRLTMESLLAVVLVLCWVQWPLSVCLADSHSQTKASRYFGIDYEHDTFVKDGKPFRYVSGSIHYFRVLQTDWHDRLRKARLGGLNTIQTYIEWSSHQPEPDVFDFSGNLNFTEYCLTAQKLGLNVIVRLGPFIASERDNMGLPYWLAVNNASIVYRTRSPDYLNAVTRWYAKLLPQLVPLLYENGGPIIMGQVENEYGSYWACDSVYTTWLRDLFRRYLGSSFLLFTTDGQSTDLFKCGHIDEVYPTVDFGTESSDSVITAFSFQRLFAPAGPLVNSEFYPGWFDVWGEPHNAVRVNDTVKTLEAMLVLNSSINIYMYHGGTSFGFMNGAYTPGPGFRAMVTSYDYDAPIGDYGQLTKKYFAIREVIQKYFPDVPSLPKDLQNEMEAVLESTSQTNFSLPLTATLLTDIFQLLETMKPVLSKYPLTFEQLKLRHGFVYYQTVVPFVPSDPILLNASSLHDRALIFINGHYRCTLSRMDKIFTSPLSGVIRGDVLGLLVENQGHTCCGRHAEVKGIVGNVTLATRTLTNWQMYPLFSNWTSAIGPGGQLYRSIAKQSMATRSIFRPDDHRKKDPNDQCKCAARDLDYLPAFYVAVFKYPQQLSPKINIFLNVSGCGRKGVAFLNGFNLGRYWPVMGPQVTLFIPHSLLRQDDVNTLIILELERGPHHCLQVTLTDQHQLNGTTPDNYMDLIQP